MASSSYQLPPTPESMNADCDNAKRRKVVYDYDSDDEEAINRLVDSLEPLSSLPTPPPSNSTSPDFHGDLPNASSVIGHATVDLDFKDRFGYEVEKTASQLVKYMRASKGVKRPEPDHIEVFLKTFDCDQTIIAHAACILNSLSWRFNADWISAMDSVQKCAVICSQDSDEPATRRSELIIAAALDLSGNWLIDNWYSFGWHYSERCRKYCPRMLEATRVCILQDQNIQWNLMQFDHAEVQEWQRRIFDADAYIQTNGATT